MTNNKIPNLEPFFLDTTSLTYQSYAWAVENNIYVPYIAFSGLYGQNNNGLLDNLFMKWRVNEICEVDLFEFVKGNGLIVDLRNVVYRIGQEIKIDPVKIRLSGDPMRIIADPKYIDHLYNFLGSEKLTTDLEKACTDISFILRKKYCSGKKKDISYKKETLQTLIPISLVKSEIKFDCYKWSLPEQDILGIYLVFEGNYKFGSAGRNDAQFIRWRIEQACEVLTHNVVVIDLRYLNYEWGDDLNVYPIGFSREGSPIRILIKPEQEKNFKGVLGSQNLCFEIEKAFEQVTLLYNNKEKVLVKKPTDKLNLYLELEYNLFKLRSAEIRDVLEEEKVSRELNKIWWELEEEDIEWLGLRKQEEIGKSKYTS